MIMADVRDSMVGFQLILHNRSISRKQ
jgi:hypothetical protein